MKILKNKWILIAGFILLTGVIAVAFKDKLGPFFGGYEKLPRGYYYRFTKGKKLETVKGDGYHIVFKVVLLGPDGDTLLNKAKPGVELQRDYPVTAGNEMEDVMQIASPGSTFEILVPADSLKKRTGSNMKILALESGTNAKFVVDVLKILNDEEFAAYQNQHKLNRLKNEFDLMDEYANRHKANWKLDSLNYIKYFIDKPTDKPRLNTGDKVEFNCEVFNMRGDLIINSGMEGHKYTLTMGAGTYDISAFENCLYYVAEGESGTFLVTSDMGYKDKGYLNVVAPYAPLLIKIYDIKKLKE